MNDMNNYNEFCRLLFRFRATAPLNEMAEKPGYIEWIGLIADFTLKAIQSWKVRKTCISIALDHWRDFNSGLQTLRRISLDFGLASYRAWHTTNT